MPTDDDTWSVIDTAPIMKWIQMYSPDYHKGPGVKKNGIMQGRIYREHPEAPILFYDDFGIPINWKFTHWKEISEPPAFAKTLCDAGTYTDVC